MVAENVEAVRRFYAEAFAVDDLAAALAKIESLGGTTAMPPMDIPDGSVSIAMFRDPAGNLIGLVKPHAR